VTGVNSNAVANLSSIVKDVIIHSHDNYIQVTRNMLCLNITIHIQGELSTIIRQLEFALLQLTQQLSELMNVIQRIILGKLSVNLLNPTTLYNIKEHITAHT